MLRLHPSFVDYSLLVLYFVVVLGIGIFARRAVGTSADFLLAGRSLPAWVTGLAFVSANLGATEIIGMAANGAQYGVATVHYYWIGAVPAMVFLGIVMMPFYYRSKVRSVPEFLRRRYNDGSHVLNAGIFALAAVLIAGVNLYALSIVLQALLGLPLIWGVVLSAAVVLLYVGAGGLSSAIYGEVLQFFIIIAALLPLAIAALRSEGGWHALTQKVTQTALGPDGTHAWAGTSISPGGNPIGANWIGLVLGLGFVLSFGYWTTNFAEVQRAFSAKNISAARRTPLIAAYPKLFIPFIVVIPGLVAAVTQGLVPNEKGKPVWNDAIPALMGKLLPSGLLGLAITGLFASFMAGVAANVSSLNTVVTYDLVQAYWKKDRDDSFYLGVGRIVTVLGIVLSIFTALIASQFNNIMIYLQDLFSIFNAPIFATFIVGMFWRRTNARGGFWGLLCGVLAGALTFLLYQTGALPNGKSLAATFIQAGVAFVVDLVVSIVLSLTGPAPERDHIEGLVYGTEHAEGGLGVEDAGDRAWFRKPITLGVGALAIALVLNVVFA
ncbi:MAG: solute:Na+ symporter, family [Frankiaceae bacterium]|jgi:SSS family solute:Na+ symporter|nr:solute:Na+ symporter, family [Frankiaceae bacterium]